MLDPLIALPLACFATSLLSGVFGMAGGMLLLVVCTALLPVNEAMLVHGLAQGVANGARVLGLRQHVRWRGFGVYAAGGLAPFLGIRALGFAPEAGWMLIAAGAIPFAMRALPVRFAPRFDRPAGALACGAFTMAGQLTAGATGALLDAFFVRSALGRHGVVATKAATQTLGHLAKVVHFGGLSGFSWLAATTHTIGFTSGTEPGAAYATTACPLGVPVLTAVVASAVVGTWLGRCLLDRLGESQFRRWTRALVSVLSAVAIADGVLRVTAGR
jgi:uncharacterized membrane protein YfcA